jgi:hypothetical protein
MAALKIFNGSIKNIVSHSRYKRTLLLTRAGLPPAGSHQLCLAHSFDHLVGAKQERFRLAPVSTRWRE